MIEAKRVQAEYTIVHGLYNPQGSYNATVLHCHLTLDNTSRLPNMIRAAAEAGIDNLGITDHDSVAGHEKAQKIIDRKRYPLEILPGVEITAKNSQNKERHVLAYGAKELPPPGLSVQEVNVWAHEKKGIRTAAAHPGIPGISVGEYEMKEVQAGEANEQFDFGEVVNGTSARHDLWIDKHPFLARVLKDKIPGRNANEDGRKILEQHETLSYIGGSDAHEADGVTAVVNLVPTGMDIFEAAESKRLVILQRKDLTAISTPRLLLQLARGATMKHKTERQTKRHFAQ